MLMCSQSSIMIKTCFILNYIFPPTLLLINWKICVTITKLTFLEIAAGDKWASRMEVVTMEALRYGVKPTVASLLFDIYDTNGDGRYDYDDMRFMLPGQQSVVINCRNTSLECICHQTKHPDYYNVLVYQSLENIHIQNTYSLLFNLWGKLPAEADFALYLVRQYRSLE